MSTSRRLNQGQLRELERELRRERVRLDRAMMAEREIAEAHTPGNGELRPAESAGSDLGIAVETRTHARYEALLDALRRLELGTYGICVGCRNPIPYGRLLAMPETTRCVACAARA